MKSPANLWSAFISTWKRFPWAMVAVYIATIAALGQSILDILQRRNMVEVTYNVDSAFPEFLIKIALAGILGFFVYYALQLVYEVKKAKFKWQFVVNLVALVLLILFAWGIDFDNHSAAYGLKLASLYGGALLAAIFAPFLLIKNKEAEMVNYLFRVGGRIVMGIVFFAILFVGLLLVGHLIGFLFDINGWYGDSFNFQLWMFLAGFVAPIYVLSGVPKNILITDKEAFSKHIELAITYTLIPVALLFVGVVYVYLLKALITWSWPKDGVVEILLGFGIFGIVTYLVNLMIEGKAVLNRFYKKTFFYFLIPLIGVLFLGIGARIGEFGLTMDRTLVVMFGVVELILALYYLIAKEKKIKFAVVTVLATLLLINYGPINVSYLSRLSQWNELEEQLQELELVEDDQIQKNIIVREDYLKLSSIINYLERDTDWDYVVSGLARRFDNVDEFIIPEEIEDHKVDDYILQQIGILSRDAKVEDIYKNYFTFRAIEDSVYKVADYDYLIDYSFYRNSLNEVLVVNDVEVIVTFDVESNVLLLKSDKPEWNGKFYLDRTLQEIKDKKYEEYFDYGDLVQSGEKWKIDPSYIDGYSKTTDQNRVSVENVTDFRAYLLLQE